MRNKSRNLLYFEYVPVIAKTRIRLKIGVVEQAQLLCAGDSLLAKLSDDMPKKLNSPISCRFVECLSGNCNPVDVTPQRARAALVVAEFLQIIWEMIKLELKGEEGKERPYYIVGVDEVNGSIYFGRKVYSINKMLALIDGRIKSLRIKPEILKAMVVSVVMILYEGAMLLPGMYRKKV